MAHVEPGDVLTAVRHFISETFFVDEVDGDASFLERGIIDSTGMLELVMFVETTFGFKIADAELLPENLDSLNRVVAFVVRRQDS
jgi:acyl carrier protein